MAQLNEREHAELLMLCKNAVDDIDRTKREQWSHYYAILLAQVGVAGFSRIQFTQPGEQKGTIFAAFALLLVLGITLIILHQVRLYRLRELIHRCSAQLETNTKEILEWKEAQPLLRITVPSLMIIVLVLVCWFLYVVVSPDVQQSPLDRK